MAFTEKYVSVSGAGAHDGSSEANAWTFEEAIAAPVASGCRVNVKSGTHTLTASRTLPTGSSESPIEWRGYKTTIGDLLTVGRDATTGELIHSDFPVIDCGASYALTNGPYTSLKNLSVTSGGNFTTLIGTSAVVANVWRCRVENTHTNGGSARAYQNTSVYGSIVDCDCIIASSNLSAGCLDCGRGSAYGNRCWNTTTTPGANQSGIIMTDVGSSAVGNVIFHCGVAITSGGNNSLICGNTWYDVITGVYLNGNNSPVIANNVGWLHSGYGIRGVASSGNPLIWNNALGSFTSGRIDTGTLGSIIEELSGISLTSDPFTDSTNKDFSINNTAGGGALCRASSTLWGGFADLGAIQTQSSGGTLLTGLKRGIRL